MLIYLPPGGKAALISVPRDSYVDIPGHGKNKINAAYAFGGPELMVQTIERNSFASTATWRSGSAASSM